MINLHDTHFHLDLFNEKALLIANEIEEKKIYTIAVTNLPQLYVKLLKTLNNKYKYIRPALGFHPELIGEYNRYIPQMWKLLPGAKYIGEVGLDYKTSTNSKAIQINFFETLIEKCHELGNKILTVHSRNSSEDIISIIGNNFDSKVILHWYSGNIRTLRRAVENGAYFSINYSMTNSVNGKKIISEIPKNRLLIESDGPFVKINKSLSTPLNSEYIIKNLSTILNINSDDTYNLLSQNFKSLLIE